MLTDRGTELPIATIHALPLAHATWASRQRAALVGWLTVQWRFLRPRLAPSLVALAGMFAVLGSMRALTVDPPLHHKHGHARTVWYVRAGDLWTCSSEAAPAGAVQVARDVACVRTPAP